MNGVGGRAVLLGLDGGGGEHALTVLLLLEEENAGGALESGLELEESEHAVASEDPDND